MSDSEIRLNAALAYAGHGLHVFPCHFMAGDVCSCGKNECHSPGKHPRTPDGFKSATTDQSRIRNWWSACPEANVAVRTGPESGVWVLDLDGPEGIAAFAEMVSRFGSLPKTVSALTGGGGQHLFFKCPTDCEIKSRTKIGSKPIDTRGAGGYVIVPPSNHKSGRAYAWENSPGATAFAEAPAWLLELLQSKVVSVSSPATIADPTVDIFDELTAGLDLRTAPGVSEGGRHNRACQLVGSHLGRGDDANSVLEWANEWNNRCKPPMDLSEIQGIVESLAKKDAAKQASGLILESEAPWPILDPELRPWRWTSNLYGTGLSQERWSCHGRVDRSAPTSRLGWCWNS